MQIKGRLDAGRLDGMRRALTVAAATVLMAVTGTAASGADNIAKGQRIWMTKAGCPFCHGWAADGAGDAHSEGPAPSLRTIQLTRDQIREVIQCGRPGSQMPHFDAFAYTDDRCYGATAEDLGDQKPNDPPVPLQPHEIDALADYIDGKLRDAGPITREECEVAFGGGSQECNRYPPANASLSPAPVEADHAGLTGENGGG